MFKFRSKKQRANETLLALALRGDAAITELAAHITESRPYLDLNVRDAKTGATALMLAVIAGAQGAVRVLAGFGADVNIPTSARGETPLMMALSLGRTDIARDLLVAGADVEKLDHNNKSATDVAAASKKENVKALLPWLKREKSLDDLKAVIAAAAKDEGVINAVKSGRIDALAKALETGNPNAIDADGQTALGWAAHNNNAAAIALLAEKGAAVSFQSPAQQNNTTLHAAVWHNAGAAVTALLKAGADTSLKNARGRTPYDSALTQLRPQLAMAIAAHDLSKAADEAGKTLHARRHATAELVLAMENRDVFHVHDALKKSPSLDVVVDANHSLLTRAVELRSHGTLALLLAAGADLNARDAAGRVVIVEAAKEKDNVAVLALLSRGADVNQQDAEGETALSQMLMQGQSRAVNALIDAGADASLRNKFNRTVLESLARWEGQENTIRRIAQKGGKLDGRDGDGNTPLLIAAKAKWKGNTQALIDGGADIFASNNKGETLLLFAKAAGWDDIVKKLETAQLQPKSGATAAQTPAPGAAPQQPKNP